MDTSNFVTRLDRLEIKDRHNHLDIFGEFLDHLGVFRAIEATSPRPTNCVAPTSEHFSHSLDVRRPCKGRLYSLQIVMLAPSSEPTVASVFAPRTTIDADGTVEGYASLFGEIDQARNRVMRGAF